MTNPECGLSLGQKVALEHTAKTAADGKLGYTFCACVRGRRHYLHVFVFFIEKEKLEV